MIAFVRRLAYRARRALTTRPLARTTLTSVVVKGLSVVLAFLLSLALARLLGLREYGTYEYILAWFMVLLVPAGMGLDKLAVRVMAATTERGDPGLARGFLRWSRWVVVVAGATLGGAAALFGWFQAGAEVTPRLIAWWIGCALLPMTSLTLVWEASVRGLGHVIAGQLPVMLARPVVVLGVVGALAATGDAPLTAVHALVALLVGTGVALGLAWSMLRRAVPTAIRLAPARTTSWAWLGAALPMMLMGALTASNHRIGTIVLGALHGPEATGIYAVAVRGADLVTIALVAFNTALAPTFASLLARSDTERLQRVVTASARGMSIVALPMVVALYLAAEVYLGLFGASFVDGTAALRVLLLGQLVNVATGSVGVLLVMGDREQLAMAGVAIGVALNLALAFVLVPSFGITGAAVAAATSTIVWNGVLWVMAARSLGVDASVVGALRTRR